MHDIAYMYDIGRMPILTQSLLYHIIIVHLSMVRFNQIMHIATLSCVIER